MRLPCLEQGVLTLPGKKPTGSTAPRKHKVAAGIASPNSALCGSVEEFAPVTVKRVQDRPQRQLFQELVGRYHYPGDAMPYGARLQYLVYVTHPRREVAGAYSFRARPGG